MRIAITSISPNLSGAMDERFGRTKYFLIVSSDGELLEAVDNNVNINAMQGAGVSAAQLLVDKKVDCLITGHVGPKAFSALQQAGIPIFTSNARTCEQAFRAYKAGELGKADSSDVKSHW